MDLLLIIVTYVNISGTLCYVLRCPENKEKELRSRYFCINPLEYHCLKNYTSKLYTETCRKSSLMVEGTQAILNNMNINDERCIPKQYQPFVTLSNETNKCQYNKDLCTEKGQVIFSNGTAIANSLCGCDYRKGFLFVTNKSNHICDCDPAQEDCSCIFVDCEYSKELNPDNVCRDKVQLKRKIQTCPEIEQVEQYKEYITESRNYKDSKTSTHNSAWTLLYITLIIIVTVGFVLFSVACLIGWSRHIDAEFERRCPSCYNRDQKFDIAVLGIEKEVTTAISELNDFAENFDKWISFSDNHKNEPLDKLLKSCRFIFILYTDNFEKEYRGLSERDLKKIRRQHDHPKIKIICKYNREKVMNFFWRIDMDLLNEEKNDDFGKDGTYEKIINQLIPANKKTKRKIVNSCIDNICTSIRNQEDM